jgi:hypothetical protein
MKPLPRGDGPPEQVSNHKEIAMLRKLLFASALGLGLLVPAALASPAEAHEWHHGHGWSHWHAGFHVGVPAYRPRVYVAPAPVYVAPAPVYVQPAPVVVEPAPTYVTPPVIVR